MLNTVKNKFRSFDLVKYVGGSRTINSLASKVGEVAAPVHNTAGEYVVEFGDDSFIIKEKDLVRFVPSKEAKDKEVILQKTKARFVEEDK